MDREKFLKMSSINVNDKTEQKNGLTYLSWAWAWKEFVEFYPDATYEIKTFDGKPYIQDATTGYMVWTSITADGDTKEMWLPVMDNANKAMKDHPYKYVVTRLEWDAEQRKKVPVQTERVCETATMFDINKTIMRCLVKNMAMFGLGLYIYAGEDLPEPNEDK